MTGPNASLSHQSHSPYSVSPNMSAKDQLDDIKDAGILESVPVDESTVPIPESLRELSDAELRAMEKRIVRKADLVLM